MSKAEQMRRVTTCDVVVAEWAGCTLHELHVLHPVDFGSPRDFRWDGLHYCYTAPGLRRLQAALREAGQALGAARLNPLVEMLEPAAESAAVEIGLRLCA